MGDSAFCMHTKGCEGDLICQSGAVFESILAKTGARLGQHAFSLLSLLSNYEIRRNLSLPCRPFRVSQAYCCVNTITAGSALRVSLQLSSDRGM